MTERQKLKIPCRKYSCSQYQSLKDYKDGKGDPSEICSICKRFYRDQFRSWSIPDFIDSEVKE